MTRPARVVIDLAAGQANLQKVKQYAPEQKIIAIIKADAYGHGLERMSSVYDQADAFGVACFEEAIRLRTAGAEKAIMLLEGVFSKEELLQLAELNIQTVVHQYQQLAWLEELPPEKAVTVWLKIDTGMHRLGFDPDQVEDVYQRLVAASGVKPEIRLMTHFASAEEPSVVQQLDCFSSTVSKLAGAHCLANSGAVIDRPDTHGEWIRPGLMLYGISPFDDRTAADLGLVPVMSLHSELITVKHAKQGEKVGYGGTWECPEDMQIGVVALGYGDGYPRHAASGTPMLINGNTAKLIGRPSMDMLTVDLRECPDAKIGDDVLLWGNDLPVETIARCADTIPYELLCGMRMRARFVEING